MLPIKSSYDRFFAGHSRVNGIQFWGLNLLGGTFVAGGCGLLVILVRKVATDPLDVWELLLLSIPVAICCSIIYFGILHIKRAFAARR